MTKQISSSVSINIDVNIYMDAYRVNSTEELIDGELVKNEDKTGNFSTICMPINDILDVIEIDDERISHLLSPAEYKHKPCCVVYLRGNFPRFNLIISSDSDNRRECYIVVPYSSDDVKLKVARTKDKLDLFENDIYKLNMDLNKRL